MQALLVKLLIFFTLGIMSDLAYILLIFMAVLILLYLRFGAFAKLLAFLFL